MARKPSAVSELFRAVARLSPTMQVRRFGMPDAPRDAAFGRNKLSDVSACNRWSLVSCLPGHSCSILDLAIVVRRGLD